MVHQLDHSNPCPECGESLDGVTPATDDDRPPEPGDLSVCAYCGVMLQFDADLKSQPLTAEEFVELPVEVREQLKGAVRVIKELPR